MTKLVDTPKNQHEAVLWHLNEYNTITSWEAIKEYGVTRLSAIIFNLRNDGYQIDTNMKTKKNRFGNSVSYSEYTIKSYLPETGWVEKPLLYSYLNKIN